MKTKLSSIINILDPEFVNEARKLENDPDLMLSLIDFIFMDYQGGCLPS